MSIIRTIICDCCGSMQSEQEPDSGFPGWVGIHGIVWDGVPDPKLCPSCLVVVMSNLESRKSEVRKANGLD